METVAHGNKFIGDCQMKKLLKFILFMVLLSLFSHQPVQAQSEESACQIANTCQSLFSQRVTTVTDWSDNKEAQLRQFILEWQERMEQSYVEYDVYQVNNKNLFDNISVEGMPVNINHHSFESPDHQAHTNWQSNDRITYDTYTIYAIYKSEDPHLYLFGYEHNHYYPVVLYTDLQTYNQGMIEFWPTQNQELADAFQNLLIFGKIHL